MSAGDWITFYFYLFSALMIFGAVGVVALRNIFHSALSMTVSLFAVAGLFVLLNAEFLAAVQVIIYVGAIMVLIIFAILVSTRIMRRNIIQTNAYVVPAAIASLAFFAVTVWVLAVTIFVEQSQVPNYPLWFSQVEQKMDNTTIVGWSLAATYVLPFIVISILLLMALIGAVVLAQKSEDDKF